MERYVLVFNYDTESQEDSYWGGDTPTQTLNESLLFPDLVSARQQAGVLQSQFTDCEVTVKKVTTNITIAE